jgi:hypothetical protein
VSSSSVHVIDVCLSYIKVEAKNIQLMVKAKKIFVKKRSKVEGKNIQLMAKAKKKIFVKKRSKEKNSAHRGFELGRARLKQRCLTIIVMTCVSQKGSVSFINIHLPCSYILIESPSLLSPNV